MPFPWVLLAFLATAVAHSPQEEQDPDSVFLLQTGVDLGSTLGRANHTRQTPEQAYDFIHDDDSRVTPTSTTSTTPVATTPAPAPAPAPRARGPKHPEAWYVRRSSHFEWKAVFAEYIAMTLYIIVGCGSAMAIARDMGSAWILQIAFSFGLAYTTLAWGVGRFSGGQINCAVTLAMWICGKIGWAQALLNFVAQILGSITGAVFLGFLFPKHMDKTGALACNSIGDGFKWIGVLLGECIMTFLLVMTILESSSQTDTGMEVLPAGFAVFLAHCLLIPMDGCSINPTRSLGPALVASIQDGKPDYFLDHELFWAGPVIGAAVGAGIHSAFLS